MNEDPNLVYVFVEDNEAENGVTMTDVSYWLGIIDEVEQIKLQYDANSGRMCYQVRFRQRVSAHQAVQYLSGTKLKNCTLSIQSRVFKKQQDAPCTAGGTGNIVSRWSQSKERNDAASMGVTNTTEVLPFNGKLPAELQMDAALADVLPTLAEDPDCFPNASKLAEELNGEQAKLVELLAAISDLEEKIKYDNETLKQSLSSNKEDQVQIAIETFPLKEDCEPSPTSLVSRVAIFSNSTGIAVSECSPISFVLFLTKRFGPISQCECLINPDTEFYFLSFQFMMPSDADAFKECTAANLDKGPDQPKKLRVEMSSCEQSLFGHVWNTL